MQFVFVCSDASGAAATPSAGSSTPPPPQLLPTLWLPNAHGLVLFRAEDSHYIRITRDFTLDQFIYTDLGLSTPSAANYETISTDGEWESPWESFGFYDGINPPCLALLEPLQPIATAVQGGHELTKGLLFAPTYAPILRTGINQRVRITFNMLNQFVFTLL